MKNTVFSTEIEPQSPVGKAEYTPLHHWGDDNAQSSIINKEDKHDIKMYVYFYYFPYVFFHDDQ